MTLDFLEFDYSEDDQGHGTFDAMAAAGPAQLAALQAEIVRVLQWAEREFPDAQGPLEEGGEWDVELQGVQELPTTLDVQYQGGKLRLQPREVGAARVTLSVTLSGTPMFCAAFRHAFGMD
jgi:hypothetical protein